MSMVDVFRSLGRNDALKLREKAKDMTGTQIIAQEVSVPAFDPQKDYTSWPVGAPVADENQVWLLIQPYNAANYPQRPSELRALWGLAHTTDPERAKPWVAPYGTSGLYNLDEVYKEDDGKIYKCIVTQTNFRATEVPSQWEEVIMSD